LNYQPIKKILPDFEHSIPFLLKDAFLFAPTTTNQPRPPANHPRPLAENSSTEEGTARKRD
jgi:hypothetical protein